jgi:hypothetical protein
MPIDRNHPTKKLSPKYCGLYMIIEKMSHLVYKLDLLATLRIHLVFHISTLGSSGSVVFCQYMHCSMLYCHLTQYTTLNNAVYWHLLMHSVIQQSICILNNAVYWQWLMHSSFNKVCVY